MRSPSPRTTSTERFAGWYDRAEGGGDSDTLVLHGRHHGGAGQEEAEHLRRGVCLQGGENRHQVAGHV